MRKNSRIEMAREIIANLKREMAKPRLAASVRDALEAEPALAVEEPVAWDARA
jgi:hypothetical protein